MKIHTFFPALAAVVLLTACGAEEMDDTKMDDMAATSSAAMMDDKDDAEMTKSSLTFVGGSSVVDHQGGFATFTVDVGNSDDLVNSTVTATVDLTSVYTDTDRLTEHLQKEDFFNVATYPEATFTSTSVVAVDDGYTITGDLSLKGVTKSITMAATLDDDVFTANFDIPRKEFNVGNDSYGDKLLDEMIPVTATVYLK